MIPVLIPIKEISERCPQKNEYLLKYTLEYLEKTNRLNATWVISDSEKLLSLAQKRGAKVFKETVVIGQNEKHACWKFLQNSFFERIFICPVTQPFRDFSLLKKTEDLYDREKVNIDFVTSVTLVPDREQFYVNIDKSECSFKLTKENRLGATCMNTYMIDGALYLINSNFLEECVNSEHCTNHFWNGRFAGAINNAPFIDIDTEDDLNKFKYLEKYFEKI
ncbi:glycosyltransferase family protein [Sphingobacterium faecale]|uniref:CMP-N-acetylneuraminic acid synthetase n=1 Tax=Sphingobacterium faecale TaxID=2803775 RepID=A0ABS1R0K4_9SPHI|nr:hypothetical protein [Sphingobacterium faecale]MBL1408200.1 hypothetical protein [Sphingobacterium faecale]